MSCTGGSPNIFSFTTPTISPTILAIPVFSPSSCSLTASTLSHRHTRSNIASKGSLINYLILLEFMYICSWVMEYAGGSSGMQSRRGFIGMWGSGWVEARVSMVRAIIMCMPMDGWVVDEYYQYSQLQYISQMSEVSLLKQYIKTLESQNSAKNTQRETLYCQISSLSDQNTRLLSQLSALQQQSTHIQQAHTYIAQLEQTINYMRGDFENTVRILEERNGEIGNLRYQQEKDAERIVDLEAINKECRKNQIRLREEIGLLRDEVKALREKEKEKKKERDICEDCVKNQDRINQLMENYEKIEKFAREKDNQNEFLSDQNRNLQQTIQQLQKRLSSVQTQLKNVRKTQTKRQQTSFSHSAQKEDRSFKEDLFTNISLIRQNNRLIERVTELEKEKNMLYLESFDSSWRAHQPEYSRASYSPLRSMSARPSPHDYDCQEKIRGKIQVLKSVNQSLLQKLKI